MVQVQKYMKSSYQLYPNSNRENAKYGRSKEADSIITIFGGFSIITVPENSSSLYQINAIKATPLSPQNDTHYSHTINNQNQVPPYKNHLARTCSPDEKHTKKPLNP